MNCREVTERLEEYILGALESRETEAVRRHTDACADCSAALLEHGNVAAELALAVPQFEAPAHVKTQLMSRIEAEVASTAVRTPSRSIFAGLSRLLPRVGPSFAPRTGLVVAPLLVLVMFFGGFWFNDRLTDIAEDRDALADKVEVMAEDGAEMKQMVKNQQYLIYAAAEPGQTVNLVSETRRSAQARGVMVVPVGGNAPLLAALDLPPLPTDHVYQVWLIVRGRVYSAGTFKVDSTGYAQTRISLPMTPMREIYTIDAVVITVERAGGSPGPTGESVLRGDL